VVSEEKLAKIQLLSRKQTNIMGTLMNDEENQQTSIFAKLFYFEFDYICTKDPLIVISEHYLSKYKIINSFLH